MIFFSNDNVVGDYKIDVVIDNFIYTATDQNLAMSKVLRELCMLLDDDQQKKLVESLYKNNYKNNYKISPNS